MRIYLVYEHNYTELEFRGAYDDFDVAIDHAKAIHRHAHADIREVDLLSSFKEHNKPAKHKVVWSSSMQSGAI